MSPINTCPKVFLLAEGAKVEEYLRSTENKKLANWYLYGIEG